MLHSNWNRAAFIIIIFILFCILGLTGLDNVVAWLCVAYIHVSYALQYKSLWLVFMFLKEVPYAHRAFIYLIKNTVIL